MRTPHSTFQKGKQIRVILRDGTVIVSPFRGKRKGYISLEAGDWPMREVRATCIYKPLNESHARRKNT